MEEIRRGPGRPPGSPNRPPERPLSLEQRKELTERLSGQHAEAVVAHALSRERLRGIKALAKTKLGTAGLHEIEAGLGNAREEIDANRP